MRLGAFGYYVDFVGAAVASLVLGLLTVASGGWVVAAQWLACLLLGVWLWTLLEYVIHH